MRRSYATAHHFEGYISEVSFWQRALSPAEITLLATANPLSDRKLNRDLIAYWCIYQRETTSAPVLNAVKLTSSEPFHGVFFQEGTVSDARDELKAATRDRGAEGLPATAAHAGR